MGKNTFVGQVTVKAILRYRGSFVIVKEDEDIDHWILTGGRLDIGETPEECLEREIEEELSIRSTVGSIVGASVYHGGGKHSPKAFLFYAAEALPGEISIKHEIVGVAYVSTKAELNKYPMHENQKNMLRKFLQ